eukprot:CAMPEP_0113967542 /NCGR_PEP_ID=MMETSP0011_2-20120614/9000_1 /TAXON_ID=101924 /ORGANISM="Rhodosorus marinus" /LENGTH=456 /DNA_ID=CAMNT_0000980461 /DNA_START=392 /DNA_END=1762 /DNA_ORIENTATION=- /assembly_acc=CAM_ASM_000156
MRTAGVTSHRPKRVADIIDLYGDNKPTVVEQMKALLESHPSWKAKCSSFTYSTGIEHSLVLLFGILDISPPLYYHRGMVPSRRVPVRVWIPYGFPKERPIVIVEVPLGAQLVRRDFLLSGSSEVDVMKVLGRGAEVESLGLALVTLTSLFSSFPPLFVPPNLLHSVSDPPVTRSSSFQRGKRQPTLQSAASSTVTVTKSADLERRRSPSSKPTGNLQRSVSDSASKLASRPGSQGSLGQSTRTQSTTSVESVSSSLRSSPSRLPSPAVARESQTMRTHTNSYTTESDVLKRQMVAAVTKNVRDALVQVTEKSLLEVVCEQSKLVNLQKTVQMIESAKYQRSIEFGKKANALLNEDEKLRNQLDVQLRLIKEIGEVDLSNGRDIELRYPMLINQIVTSRAEDFALRDALDVLDEACSKGVLGLDSYLKAVGEVGRQQFFVRATYRKASFAMHAVGST